MAEFNENMRAKLKAEQTARKEADLHGDVRYQMQQRIARKSGTSLEEIAEKRGISVEKLVKENSRKKGAATPGSMEKSGGSNNDGKENGGLLSRWFGRGKKEADPETAADETPAVTEETAPPPPSKDVETFPIGQVRDDIVQRCQFALVNAEIKGHTVPVLRIEFDKDTPPMQVEVMKAALESKQWDKDEQHSGKGYAPVESTSSKGLKRLNVIGESRIASLVAELLERKVPLKAHPQFQCSDRLRISLDVQGVKLPEGKASEPRKG